MVVVHIVQVPGHSGSFLDAPLRRALSVLGVLVGLAGGLVRIVSLGGSLGNSSLGLPIHFRDLGGIVVGFLVHSGDLGLERRHHLRLHILLGGAACSEERKQSHCYRCKQSSAFHGFFPSGQFGISSGRPGRSISAAKRRNVYP